MTHLRRELMLKLCDGDMRIPPILHQLDAYVRCDEILTWLLKNNFKGKELFNLVTYQHSNSVQSVVKSILKLIDKDVSIRPILLGKDWLPKH